MDMYLLDFIGSALMPHQKLTPDFLQSSSLRVNHLLYLEDNSCHVVQMQKK